jgi:hypothetical protein
MRRIMMLVTAALVMAAMMVAMTAPAFAAGTCREAQGDFTCSGGSTASQPGGISNGSVGGQGGHFVDECDPECGSTVSGGGGQTTEEGGGVDSTGGGGGRCFLPVTGSNECVGTLGG